ncbi:MAG TPA: DoxX family protein [Gemmatimonadaceae bacterium]|nr:DoxX family protein [Gemmatimonadaceae bacterium]
MNILDPLPLVWRDRTLSVLRIAASFMFMLHGTQKLFGVPTIEPREPVELMSLFGVAGVLEVFGGFLLLIGLFTRVVAFVLSGEMAVAYFMVHLPQNPWPVLNGGEPAALYAFLFLYFAVAGAGVWSVDAQWRRGRHAPGTYASADHAGRGAT